MYFSVDLVLGGSHNDPMAPTNAPRWTNTLGVVRVMPLLSKLVLKPNLPLDLIASLNEDTSAFAKVSLIGIYSTKHPTKTKFQQWVDVKFVGPNTTITKVHILHKQCFIFTFSHLCFRDEPNEIWNISTPSPPLETKL